MDLREAREVIGHQEAGDYILDPVSHRDLYKNEAPGLSEILDRNAVREFSVAYSLMDKEAIASAKSYRAWMRVANFGAFFTSVFSAGGMAVFLISDNSSSALTVSTTLSGLACVSAAFGAASLFFLRQGQLLETWMRRRATAETHRIAYFNQVLSEAIKRPSPVPILGLEYFRRYQFGVQKDFFQTRSAQHEKSAKKTVAIGAIGAFFATIASFFGVAHGAEGHALSAVAVFGAALGAYSIGREQMTQDRRNAERYERTYASLLELTKTLDRVCEAVIAGNSQAAREFASAVEEHISNEHRQWLQETEATNTSLKRIETALAMEKSESENTEH